MIGLDYALMFVIAANATCTNTTIDGYTVYSCPFNQDNQDLFGCVYYPYKEIFIRSDRVPGTWEYWNTYWHERCHLMGHHDEKACEDYSLEHNPKWYPYYKFKVI